MLVNATGILMKQEAGQSYTINASFTICQELKVLKDQNKLVNGAKNMHLILTIA
jgi:hypothetical protein